MKVLKVDPQDAVMRERFLDFFVSSKSLPQVDIGSAKARRLQAESYLDYLKSSDIITSCSENNEEPLIYLFFKKSKKAKSLYLRYFFANNVDTNFIISDRSKYKSLPNTRTGARGFFLCSLKAMEDFNCHTIIFEVRRKNKVRKFLSYIKFFCSFLTIKEDKIKKIYSGKIKKEDIINELSKF